MGGLADFPHDLVTLEEWDALDLDEARRWELVEGGIVMTPRPRPLLDADPDERFVAHLLREGTYQRVGALVGDRVQIKEPLALDFALDELTQP